MARFKRSGPIGAWIEITKSAHGHGGEGWEFGTCLWSPSADRRGRDRYRFMRQVRPGDPILHGLEADWGGLGHDTKLCAASVAADSYKELETEPPKAGSWAGRESYYRIPLKEFEEFSETLSIPSFTEAYREELLSEIREGTPKYYPFATYGDGVRTVQGLYLGRCTANLLQLFREALEIEGAEGLSSDDRRELQQEYAERRRRLREQYSFSRNSQLVRDAKAHYDCTCQGCGFNFEEFYGELGAGYAECHHLLPVSKQEPDTTSTLEDVTVLCANCHRTVHRKTPPLAVEELRRLVSANRD